MTIDVARFEEDQTITLVFRKIAGNRVKGGGTIRRVSPPADQSRGHLIVEVGGATYQVDGTGNVYKNVEDNWQKWIGREAQVQ